MILVALGKNLFPREKETFSTQDVVAVWVGSDDFKSYLFLLIGANHSTEALRHLLTEREGDTYSPFSQQ